ncbi:cytochrome P450 2C5-like [Rhinophrynus dorsalis]
MTVTDPVTILLSIIICLGLVKVFYGRKRNIYRNFPPGPSPLPLIGNINILNLKKPFKTFIELSKQYGSVFSIQIGPQKMVVLCGYETVKDALVNYAEEFSERPVIPIFLKTSNRYGVVFSHGKNWKVMRQFTISTLRDFGMGKKSLKYKINEECNFLVQTFNSYGGKPFENYTIMNAAVANIIISILLGHRFEYDNPTFLRLMKLINQNVELLGSPTVLLYNNYPSLMDWLPGCHKTILKNTEELINFMQETFTKSKDQLDLNDKRNSIDAFLFKQKQMYFSCGTLASLCILSDLALRNPEN